MNMRTLPPGWENTPSEFDLMPQSTKDFINSLPKEAQERFHALTNPSRHQP